jgi:hypothetical protein
MTTFPGAITLGAGCFRVTEAVSEQVEFVVGFAPAAAPANFGTPPTRRSAPGGRTVVVAPSPATIRKTVADRIRTP